MFLHRHQEPAADSGRTPGRRTAREGGKADDIALASRVRATPDVTIALDLNDSQRSIELSMTADSALVPRADMERFLAGIEDLVVAEAFALGYE